MTGMAPKSFCSSEMVVEFHNVTSETSYVFYQISKKLFYLNIKIDNNTIVNYIFF